MNVAIIPARGGSKRIPRKNIRNFCGKPMIAWPIEIAKKSNLFDRIIVSTDDKEIANYAELFGAEVPFMRSKELSDDFTGMSEVIADAVSWMCNKGWQLDTVCSIYATSIFFTVKDLKKGLHALISGKWAYAFSVTDFEYPIFRALKENSNGGINMYYPKYFESRSQDLPLALHDAAQFYWGKPNAWLNNLKIFDDHSFPVKLPRSRVQDIDTEEDWKRAELLFKMMN